MRPWILFVAACGSPEPAPPICPPTLDALAQLHALGARAVPPRIAGDPSLIPAFGACARPTAPQREMLRTRIEAWANGPVDLRFGCVTDEGTIVAAHADRDRTGLWWTLRVGATVTVLDDRRGLALSDFSEYVQETTLTTLAIADLDGDGRLDAVDMRDDREGGTPIGTETLYAVYATGKRFQIATTAQNIEVALDVEDAVVLRFFDPVNDSNPAYRCVGPKPILGTCPGAELARAHDRAADAARELRDLTALPDRDELADLLDAIGVRDRTGLLAAAAPTPAAEHVARAIRAWANRPDDRTWDEREADELRAAQAYANAIEAALDEKPCTARPTPDDARVVAWAREHAAGKVELRERCGGLAIVSWIDPRHETERAALVRADGTILRERVRTNVSPDEGYDSRIDALLAMHGGHVIATVATEVGTKTLIDAFVDGRPVAGPMAAARYPNTPRPVASLVDAGVVLHVGDRLTSAASLRPIADHDHADTIHDLVTGATGELLLAQRADLIAALYELHAPEPLIARVRAVK